MSRWFRWYEGTTEDGKFRVVARKSRVTVRDVIALWAFILEDASDLKHRGVCERNEDFMSGILDFEDGVVETILGAMEDVGMISIGMGAITICNFTKRQFESDADPTAAERQRRKRARDKDVSNEDVTRDLRPPESRDREQKETTPSGVVSRALPLADLEGVTRKLVDAVGEGKIHPHGIPDISSVIGLIEAGVDLETDILPTIRARAMRMTRIANSWGYFTDAIRDAHVRRIQAGKGVVSPKPFDESDDRWIKRLKLSRERRQWSFAEYGPAPGQPGCRVPRHLLEPSDGVGWKAWDEAA